MLGSGPPEEAIEVTRAVRAFGFDASCSLVRDDTGAVVRLDAAARRAYDEIQALGRRASRLLGDGFQRPLVDRGEAAWKCRAGARTFHVCEDGLVHLCAPRTGAPGIPLADYGEADLRRAFHEGKPCAARCPVAYAHHASRFDRFRPQAPPAAAPPAGRRPPGLRVVAA